MINISNNDVRKMYPEELVQQYVDQIVANLWQDNVLVYMTDAGEIGLTNRSYSNLPDASSDLIVTTDLSLSCWNHHWLFSDDPTVKPEDHLQHPETLQLFNDEMLESTYDQIDFTLWERSEKTRMAALDKRPDSAHPFHDVDYGI